jgi:hypothetical protein
MKEAMTYRQEIKGGFADFTLDKDGNLHVYTQRILPEKEFEKAVKKHLSEDAAKGLSRFQYQEEIEVNKSLSKKKNAVRKKEG